MTRSTGSAARTIGGRLDWRDLVAPSAGAPYDQRAQHHRPTDPALLAAEIRRLHGSGLTAEDISAALKISLVQVREILARTGTTP